MKQKDIALIAIVVFISAIFSYMISNAIFASPKKRSQKVEVVEPIDTVFERPGERYFNANSLNPTKQIKIGENPNTKPFDAPPQQ